MNDSPERHAAPKCPRCHSVNLELGGFHNYPSEPGRPPMYVYKCECGLAFTSCDPPPKISGQLPR